MVDKVNTRMISKDNVPTMLGLMRKLARLTIASHSDANAQKRPQCDTDKTPYASKTARRLCETPTDKDMPSPTKAKPMTEWSRHECTVQRGATKHSYTTTQVLQSTGKGKRTEDWVLCTMRCTGNSITQDRQTHTLALGVQKDAAKTIMAIALLVVIV